MTPTDLRIKFKLKTGINAVHKVNSKNRRIYLSDRYVKWLENDNIKLREQFKRDTGLNATFIDANYESGINETKYKDAYKIWLEDKFCTKIKRK
jgi:hypothetical protein